MSKTHSMRPRYLVAALLGVAAGGLIVAVTTRAFPKMMTEMKEPHCGAEDLCKQMMASMEQTTEHPTCES